MYLPDFALELAFRMSWQFFGLPPEFELPPLVRRAMVRTRAMNYAECDKRYMIHSGIFIQFGDVKNIIFINWTTSTIYFGIEVAKTKRVIRLPLS